MDKDKGLFFKGIGVLVGLSSIVSFTNPENWPVYFIIILSFGVIIYGLGIIISKTK